MAPFRARFSPCGMARTANAQRLIGCLYTLWYFYILICRLSRHRSSAILASIGLEVLGLGPVDAPTLGMTLYWVNYNAALINGWWWWWLAPLVIILIVFLGLFFLTVGLDEIANPRLRRAG
jgi:ABC-type dipeptide/oligopeptide/nickel transport system permease subunit